MNYKRQCGFTLVELLIAMMLTGLLALGIVIVTKSFFTQQEIVQFRSTEQDSRLLREALEKYRLTHGYLPCPASLTAPLDSTSFGEPVHGNNCAAVGNIAGTFRTTGSDGRTVRIGAVPVAALDLHTGAAFDRWNRRLTYAVTEDLTQGGAGKAYAPGAIRVQNAQQQDILSNTGQIDMGDYSPD